MNKQIFSVIFVAGFTLPISLADVFYSNGSEIVKMSDAEYRQTQLQTLDNCKKFNKPCQGTVVIAEKAIYDYNWQSNNVTPDKHIDMSDVIPTVKEVKQDTKVTKITSKKNVKGKKVKDSKKIKNKSKKVKNSK